MRPLVLLLFTSGCSLYFGGGGGGSGPNHYGDPDAEGIDTGGDCPSYGCNTCGLMPTPDETCSPGASCQYEDWEHGCSCACTGLGRWACSNETVGSHCPVGGFSAWNQPAPLDINTAADETGASLDGSGKDLVFARGGDLWFATRSGSYDQWNAPLRIANVSTAATESDPSMSHDGQTLYFTRGTTTMTAPRIALTTWGTPTEVASLAGFTSADTASHDLSVVADKAGDLYESRRTSTSAAWPPPHRLTELATTTIERAPTMRGDGYELIFESNRSGHHRLYAAYRNTIDGAWGSPTEIMVFGHETANLSDPELSADGSLLYFVSDRSGDKDIYEMTRSYE